TSDQAKALYTNIHDHRGGSNRENHRGGGSNRGGSCGGSRSGSRVGKGGKRGGNSRGGKGRKNDFDPNKYCTVHGRQGHDAEHCRKAASERKEEEGGNGPRKSDRPYQPSFERYQMSVKVTRFTANNTQIEPAHNPHEWIVDSAANAYITSFKHTLHNYVEFPSEKGQRVQWQE